MSESPQSQDTDRQDVEPPTVEASPLPRVEAVSQSPTVALGKPSETAADIATPPETEKNSKGDADAPATPEPFAPGSVIEGKVFGMNKGGLEVQCGDVRAFMPASQVDLKPLKDISVLLGETVRCEVIEADDKRQKIVVSRRAVLRREQVDSRKKLLEEIEVGQIHGGVVKSLAEFGAFVDIGGIHGLVHISDMCWGPVEKPEDVVRPGDKVKAKVLKINKERRRISLGMKQITPDPWGTVEQDFPVGKNIKARVVKMADYGAFARIAEGVNGLIPMSELSWTLRPAKPDEILAIDQEVDVLVIGVEGKRRRISLSLKQLTDDPWKGVPEAFEKGATVKGKVSGLLEFGALVELKPGVEGMIHISEISENRIRTPGDVLKIGDEVEVRILNVEPKKRRVALSMRAPREMAAVAAGEPHVKKQRKKPLRGGLESHFEW